MRFTQINRHQRLARRERLAHVCDAGRFRVDQFRVIGEPFLDLGAQRHALAAQALDFGAHVGDHLAGLGAVRRGGETPEQLVQRDDAVVRVLVATREIGESFVR